MSKALTCFSGFKTASLRKYVCDRWIGRLRKKRDNGSFFGSFFIRRYLALICIRKFSYEIFVFLLLFRES